MTSNRMSPTLSDITSSLSLSPNGKRVLLLDVQGGMNVWEGEGMGDGLDWRLVHTVRGAGEGARGVLLCQVSWWDDDVLVQGYTDGSLILTPLPLHPTCAAPLSSRLTSPARVPLNLLGQVEVVSGIPFLTPSIPSHTFSPPAPLPPLPLSHRVFILSCHRRFQRQRRIWSHLSDPEESDALYDPEAITMEATFRLLSLCESSPGEFLRRKVELKQWDDAMEVARGYDLDDDEVWKERWKAADVSATAIHQLLAKVKDRWWVLHQCATRSCDDVERRRELLDYGLTLTSFRALTAMAPSRPTHVFSSAMPDEGSLREGVDDKALHDLKLTPEQVRLCQYRLLFVQYVQRLETFTILQRSSSHHESLYPLSSMSYTAFLTCDLTAAACDLARDENFQALEAAFNLHPRELFLHRLDILDEVPLTCEPSEYQQLLPLSTSMPPTDDERTGVWVFDPHVLQQLRAADSAQSPVPTQYVQWLIQQDEDVARYRPDVPSLTSWHLRRAQRMDVETGDLQRVSSFCSLVAERDPAIGEGLLSYRLALEDVSVLVYGYEMDISVSEWQSMDPLQRLKRVLADSDEEGIVQDVLSKGGVVLQRKPDQTEAPEPLLLRFICDAVRTDLRLVRGLISAATLQLSSLIPISEYTLDAVISALYTTPRHDGDSLRVIGSILAVLPPRADVKAKKERLQQQVAADLILDKYQMGQPLSFFRSLPQEGEGGDEKVKGGVCGLVSPPVR